MNQIELLQIYCNLTETQADSFMALQQSGQRVAVYLFDALVDGGLIEPNRAHGQAHSITTAGLFVMARIQAIRAGKFGPEEARFTPAEIIELERDHAKFARMDLPLHYGLNSSSHIKALVQVAVSPGIARGTVVKNLKLAAGWLPVDLLINQKMIERRQSELLIGSAYVPLYPTSRGLALLNWCLDKAE